MTTFFNNSTVVESNDTDAHFRAWAGFIDAALTGGGWVNTSDTGQLTIATATHPTTINVDVGFRIYRMADTLQATKPIFMKVGYGASTVANTPRVNLAWGTGTDGAGNLTGVLASSYQPSPGQNSTVASNNYASVANNRAHFMMFLRGGSNDILIFSVERTKDSSGNDTGDGLLISWGNGGQLVFSSYLSTTPGSQPPVELGIPFVISNQTGSTAFGGNVGVGVVLHMNGPVVQPGMGVIVVNSADFPAEGTVTFSMYGATHTFQLSNSNTNQVAIGTGNNGFAARPTTRVGIRYE